MNIQDYTIKKKGRANSPLLPSSLRGLVIGRSNSGKTVLLLNLLLRKGWLDYDNLLVFGNSLHQEEYQVLKKGFEKGLNKEQLTNLFKNQEFIKPLEAIAHYPGEATKVISAEFYEDCEKIPDPKTLDPRKKNLIILDDCYLGRQSKAGSYYSRGRHNNCDSIYISQNYFKLERGSVRENSNFIILFPQNSKSVQHIYQDHCTDLPFDEFRDLCREIWGTKYSFLTIDLTSNLLNGKYRRNLESFYIPRAYSPEMAFIDVAPTQRDDIMKQYAKMRKEIRLRNENKKESNLLKEQAIEESAKPLIEATKESAKIIQEALKTEEIPETLVERYEGKTKDKYYSIYREDGQYLLGNTPVQIDGDDGIKIGARYYNFSKGLWDLIMLNNPKGYSDADKEAYKEIVESTRLLENPRPGPGSKRTIKYKFLVSLTEPKELEEGMDLFQKKEEEGSGIILPGNINSLCERLRLVCAERAAGNVDATTPEVVAILDELERRKKITKQEYNAMCKELGC